MNENFRLLNKNDKTFIRKLIKNPIIEDLDFEIENYAYNCFDLGEVEAVNFDAWKHQLFSYAASIDPIKESSKRTSKKLREGVKNQISSELNTLEMNVNLLINTGRYYCPDDEDLEGIISAIQSSFLYLKDCCNSLVEDVKGKFNCLR